MIEKMKQSVKRNQSPEPIDFPGEYDSLFLKFRFSSLQAFQNLYLDLHILKEREKKKFILYTEYTQFFIYLSR